MRHLLLAILCLCVPATAQIFVSPSGSNTTGNGTAGNPYRTISFAAGVATSGTVIRLAAGTYGDDDQIVLAGKELTLVGAGPGLTVVRPHATLTRTFPAGPLPGTPTEHVVAIAVEGLARVDLRDLTVDCAFRAPASGHLYGVYFRDGADGVVQRVEVLNARRDPLDASQEPSGVVVRGDNATDACTVTLRECRITEFGKAGIAARYNASVDAAWCSVRAAGDQGGTGPAQVGLAVTQGAVVLARHNTITDAHDAGNASASAGILLDTAGAGSRVEANTVARCEDCIATTQTPPAAVTTFVRNNNCTAAYRTAVRIVTQGSVLVANNVLHANDLSTSPAWDTTPGANTWVNNNFSDYGGSGSYPIPGGGNADGVPRNGCDEFTTAINVDVGMFIEKIVTGDLDGQNQPDFAVLRRGAGPRVVVGLADGAGGFTQQALTFGTGAAFPMALALGEFDGQAGTDIAVLTRDVVNTSPTWERFWIFFNNGSGSFALGYQQNLPPAVRQARALAAADVDGDSVDDLLIGCGGNGTLPALAFLAINPGTGTGTWTPAGLPSITDSVAAVAVGDLDGNGSNDAVTLEDTMPQATLRVYANDGSGTLTEVAGSPYSIAAVPTAVRLLDADVDGDLDVLATSWGAPAATGLGTLTILANDGSGGLSGRTVPTDNRPLDLAVGDLAADSDPQTVRPDALVANFGGPTLTLVGELGPDGPGLGSLCVRGAGPVCVALADMDGDGYQDALVGTAGRNFLSILPGIATAREDQYGFGCAGTAGRVPLIATAGNPGTAQWPNASYGIRVSNCLPNASAVFLLGATPGPVLAPCGLNVGTIVFSTSIVTDGTGSGVLSLPIPNLPKPFGAFFYAQFAVVDPQGPFLGFGFLSASQGMKVRVGN